MPSVQQASSQLEGPGGTIGTPVEGTTPSARRWWCPEADKLTKAILDHVAI
jgi:hypothetical protein